MSGLLVGYARVSTVDDLASRSVDLDIDEGGSTSNTVSPAPTENGSDRVKRQPPATPGDILVVTGLECELCG